MLHRRRRHPQSEPPAESKACKHARHVGTCSCCQRAQLDRWTLQLAQVQRIRPGR